MAQNARLPLAWSSMDTAPKDGTLLILLVEATEGTGWTITLRKR